MQCVILTGGLGTRMRAVNDTLRRRCCPSSAGRSFSIKLEWLARQNTPCRLVRRASRSMNRGAVGDGSQFGLSVAYADERTMLRGTGGALRLAAELGLLEDGFVVLYGDSYLPIDLLPVWQASDDGRVPTMAVMAQRGPLGPEQCRVPRWKTRALRTNSPPIPPPSEWITSTMACQS